MTGDAARAGHGMGKPVLRAILRGRADFSFVHAWFVAVYLRSCIDDLIQRRGRSLRICYLGREVNSMDREDTGIVGVPGGRPFLKIETRVYT